MSGERVNSALVEPPTRPSASTEPRLDVRGEAAPMREDESRMRRLQRSPGSMSGERPGASRREVGVSPLQRSPGSMSGESSSTDDAVFRADASTEPRLDVRGEPSSAACPDVGSRTSALSTEPRLDVRGEAPTRFRQRPARLTVQLQRSPGSMSGERGRGCGTSAARCEAPLQRSPGSMSGERPLAPGSRLRPPDAASTEPRIDVRGESTRPASRGACRDRFNGAPDRCPGRGLIVRMARPLRRPVLQRSPGSMSGERPSGGAGAGTASASTEPRIDVRGEPASSSIARRDRAASTEPRIDVRGEPRRARPRLRPCFNGAPDRCPGRAASPIARQRLIGRLQRSPGSMSGERPDVDGPSAHRSAGASTEPRIDVRGEPRAGTGADLVPELQRSPGSMSGESLVAGAPSVRRRFNGAPDRCPGRARARAAARASDASFNGAPDRCPGRAVRERPTPPWRQQRASTEPRIDVRGEERRRGAPGRPRRASTEPRIDVRGER